MTATTLTRSQRAMQIAMRTSKMWTVGVSGVNVRSQSNLARTWRTTADFCTCPDFQYRVMRGLPDDPKRCKHQISVAIWEGRNR